MCSLPQSVFDDLSETHASVGGDEYDPEEAGSGQPHAQSAALTRPTRPKLGIKGELLLAGGAVAVGVALALLRRQKKRHGQPQRAAVKPEQVFTTLVHLPQPDQASTLLAGCSFVVSEGVDIESVETRFGSSAWKKGRQPSQHSSPVVDELLKHGAACKAVTLSEPLGLGPLLLASARGAVPNPAARGRHHGGGDFGAAVSIACRLADLALCLDELGAACVPAACCGAYALRPTRGVLPLEGASGVSHSLAVPSLLAADPAALLRAGKALQLPAASSAQVARYLVAEDYFAACGEEVQAVLPAVVAAVKRWAGPEHAQGLSLCEWIYHRCTALRPFIPTRQEAPGTSRKHTAEVLSGLADAAEAVRAREFCQLHGDWVSAQAAGSLEPEVLSYWKQAQQVTEERYRSACKAMVELSGSLRGALQDGYIFVLPTIPGPAPASGDAESVAAFRRDAQQLAALASLAGVPQVVLPVSLGSGPPLAVSLICLHKHDLTLLHTAAKLGPMLQQEADKLSGEQLRSTPGSSPGADTGSGAARARGGGKGGHSTRAAADDAARRAEVCREAGNTAFKAGQYDAAVRQYSAAIQLNPRSAVSYANRAMAHLKLGLYGRAEEDCDAALGLELSVKALLRRGSARLAQGNVAGAAADFRQVLALEPQNKQAREELRGMQAIEAPVSDAAWS